MKYKIILFIIASIFLINLVSATLNVDFVSPTPINGSTVNTKNVEINANITSDTLFNNLIFNWNGTNYSYINKNLVLWLNFDNNSLIGENSSTFFDIYNNKYNFTSIGLIIETSCVYGNCLRFPANTSKLNLNIINQSMNPLNGTIMMWLKKNGNGNGTIPAYIYRANLNTRNSLNIDNNNQLIYIFGNTATNLIGPKIANNTWVHIILRWKVYNSSDNNISIYLNGQIYNSSLANKTQITGTIFELGEFGTNQDFNGSIDEFAIYNISLTDDEISNMYFGRIKKYNESSYQFYNNKTSLFNFNTYIFSVYVNNSTNEIISNRIFNINLLCNIFINYSNFLSLINQNFYGINTHNRGVSNNSQVDSDDDGSLDNYTNSTWHKQTLNDMGITYYRMDGALNDIPSNWIPPSYFIQKRDTVDYARQQGYKVMIIMSYMPDWLGNHTNQCATKNYTCGLGKGNETLWQNLTLTLWNYLNCTYDVCSIETWNEPFSHFMLEDSGTSFSGTYNKSVEFFYIHNLTYTIFKTLDSRIQIGANIDHWGWIADNISYYRYDWFLSNFSNPQKFDFLSAHIYRDDDTSTMIDYKYNLLLSNCSYYAVNCSSILLDEWNIYSSKIKNDTLNEKLFEWQLADVYTKLLNLNGTKLSSLFYMYTEKYRYGQYTDGYPQKWSAITEPQMLNIDENSYHPPYNITKQFATYHQAGASIYNSSSDYDLVKVTASKKDNYYSVTLINTDTDSINVSLNISGAGNYLMGTSSSIAGQLYFINDSIAQLDVLPSYAVYTYVTPNFTLIEGTGLQKKDYRNVIIEISTDDIWFKDNNNSHKVIASNLTGIVNTEVIINVDDCLIITNILVNGNTSGYVHNYPKGEFTCYSNTQAKLFIPIDNSIHSTILDITYDKSFAGGGVSTSTIISTSNSTTINLTNSNVNKTLIQEEAEKQAKYYQWAVILSFIVLILLVIGFVEHIFRRF